MAFSRWCRRAGLAIGPNLEHRNRSRVANQRACPGRRMDVLARSTHTGTITIFHWLATLRRLGLRSDQSAIGIGHVRGIEALEFSADGKTLATSGLDRTVKSWDVETLGERGRVLVLQTEPVALSFDPTGRTLVCLERPSPNDEQHLSVWDIASREPGLGLGPNPRVQYKVYDAQFSPDGSALATRVLGHNQEQYSIQLWPAPRDD